MKHSYINKIKHKANIGVVNFPTKPFFKVLLCHCYMEADGEAQCSQMSEWHNRHYGESHTKWALRGSWSIHFQGNVVVCGISETQQLNGKACFTEGATASCSCERCFSSRFTCFRVCSFIMSLLMLMPCLVGILWTITHMFANWNVFPAII